MTRNSHAHGSLGPSMRIAVAILVLVAMAATPAWAASPPRLDSLGRVQAAATDGIRDVVWSPEGAERLRRLDTRSGVVVDVPLTAACVHPYPHDVSHGRAIVSCDDRQMLVNIRSGAVETVPTRFDPASAYPDYYFRRIGRRWLQAFVSACSATCELLFNWRTGETRRAESGYGRVKYDLDALEPVRVQRCRGAHVAGDQYEHPFYVHNEYDRLELRRCASRWRRPLAGRWIRESISLGQGVVTWDRNPGAQAHVIATRRTYTWRTRHIVDQVLHTHDAIVLLEDTTNEEDQSAFTLRVARIPRTGGR